MRTSAPGLALAAALASFGAPASGKPAEAPLTIRIEVDASEAPRKILHASLEIPVSPGPVTLAYPQWLPGEHGPTGPVVDLAGVRIRAGEREIPWTRNPRDMYAFRIDVPPGVTSIRVDLDYLSPVSGAGFTSAASASERLAIVGWNPLVLYPASRSGSEIVCAPRLKLPEGWRHGTALRERERSGATIVFEPVSLTTLIDSPVLTGRHMREIVLAGDPKHVLHLAADGEAALAVPPDLEASYRKLVVEAGALFGARPYREYHFLLALSDHVAHFGLEHHESSDNRVAERMFVDEHPRRIHRGLLPHEFVHAWNGKFRRPATLTRDDFQAPVDSSLLWVYEGLTEYLGSVLTARSGIETPEEFREDLARIAAELDATRGRATRPLEDTATAAQSLYGASDAWRFARRSVDFYDESTLIWLEADVLIRKGSGGAKSLDDFARAFLGGGKGKPEVVPYTYGDVVATLNAVWPYEWKSFFDARVRRTTEHPPMGGIEGGGWRLAYGTTVPPYYRSREDALSRLDLTFSLGLVLHDATGLVQDVVPGSPAAKAGIGPGMTVVAVDGKQYRTKTMREALQLGAASSKPLEILVRNGEWYRTVPVEYHGGERYPVLERDPSKTDLLTPIASPRSR